MIDSIKFKDSSSFDESIKEIKFGKTNVIIGPKGGGKSTIFDILANVVNGNVFSSSVEALEDYKLEIKSVTIDGEEMPFSNLKKITIKKGAKKSSDIGKRYSERNDVLYQDDDIKKNLSDTDDFNKAKMEFAKSVVSESEDVSNFINKMRELQSSIDKIVNLQSNQRIIFSNAFKLKGGVKKSKEDMLFSLNYDSSTVLTLIKNTIKLLTEEGNRFKNFKNQLSELLISFKTKKNNKFLSEEYLDGLEEKYSKLKIDVIERINSIDKEILKLGKSSKIVKAFSCSYKKLISKLKKTKDEIDSKNKVLSSYVLTSKNHFQKMAKLLKIINVKFEEFISQDLPLKFDDEKKVNDILSLKLKGDVKYSEDEKFDILKVLLFKAKKVMTSSTSWLMSAIEKGGTKDIEDRLIFNKISEKIKNEVKVMADGNDYDTLSPGQKSIYGIEHKFNNSIGKTMFLDQPEDNLDNYTIADKILKLIRGNHEQMFIITHNANIGLLSNPDKVIIGELDLKKENPLEQYKIGSIEQINDYSDSAHYLEGGLNYLSKRFNLIKGENNEN